MNKIISFIITVSFIFLVTGAFSPSTSLFWYPGEPTRLTSILIYGGLIFIALVLFAITGDNHKVDKRVAVTAENFYVSNKEVH